MRPPLDDPAPGGDTFSAADLEPSTEEKRDALMARLDRVATAIACTALGVWAGGMIALGACAAPMVFANAPFPFSAAAMGAAFARFDNIAIGSAVVALGAEVARTYFAYRLRQPGGAFSRIRRYLVMVAGGGAVLVGLLFTPEINQLHRSGVRRGQGESGERLDSIHRKAELAGKVQVGAALVLIFLHVGTPLARRDENDEILAPGIPGGG